ncbi:GNAT family N-acetyltransferase [Reyranella sp. CPCC 100927]|uniref:GNAT family N-acetyltransferase n=1 Tax=Reyranella sp. CPCC 100927 TaxID=2599616 RepID=UPI0011B790E5|nr:GNAT family N-acetyltransferase [Reyranella sp. CPCC 100927]TWS99874.1 GNAT family N-acetyltransferase [Reyranella sp. CPCC 100927]
MSDIAIRPAAASDRPWLVAAMAAINDHERTLHDSRQPGAACADAYLTQVEKAIAAHGGAILIALQDDERVACIAFRTVHDDNAAETDDSNVFGYVSDLFVAEPARGQRLAGRLLAEAERHFRDAGLRRMRIGSLAANTPAVRAYARFGFTDYELVLEKRLAP